MSPSTGELLNGRYRLLERLGNGGMGVVYRARDMQIPRDVAVKVIRREFAADPEYRQRFQRETRLAIEIEHQNVIPVYDASTGDDLYIVMRLVAGADLQERLRKVGRIPLKQTLAIAEQVAAALEALHEKRLIHRDVKPDNVLLAAGQGREHAYLTDFGIARDAALELRDTSLNNFVGSLPYSSPERFDGDPGSECADVYSLACVIVECLTGRAPFPGPTPGEYITQHRSQPAPKVAELVPGVPEGLDAIIGWALEKDPADRPSSPAAWVTAVSRVAANGASAPRIPGPRPVTTSRSSVDAAADRSPGRPGPPSALPAVPPPPSTPAGPPATPQRPVIPAQLAPTELGRGSTEPFAVAPAAAPIGAPPASRPPAAAGKTHARRRGLAVAGVAVVCAAAVTGVAVGVLATGAKTPSGNARKAPTPTPAPTLLPASKVGTFSPAESALFGRISGYPVGPCVAAQKSPSDSQAQVAALACKPGGHPADDVIVRQFASQAAATSDARERESDEVGFISRSDPTAPKTVAFASCSGSGAVPNPNQVPARGVWGGPPYQGDIECYTEDVGGKRSRVLLWTYYADGVTIGLVRDEDSRESAQALFDWWEANIHHHSLNPG